MTEISHVRYDTEPPLDRIFTIRTANEWIRSSKKRPVPKMLFGEFWLEGELAILFADTGTGKSLLAVQIGEAIARGRSIAPLQNTAPPQTVLYFDFELSDKQFEMRYAADAEDEREYLKNHYRFSDRFCRVEIDLNAEVPGGYRSFDEYLHRSIERLVRETGAKVLIVDNITYLKRSNESTREALPLMKELKRLKKEYGLSILVLAHTPKRDTSRPISVNDLQGSKILSNFADNIFAIGQSKLEVAGRYIRHIKPRSTEMLYDASHVPSFRIGKIGGNFLGFEYERFEPEAVHLRDVRDRREWETIERIKQMSDGGTSIREIAASLGMSKTVVHRMLHMWRPPSTPPQASEPQQRNEAVPKQGRAEYDPKASPYYFPGREEYDEAGNDPRFVDIYDRDDEEARLLAREAYLIEAACARARKIYLRTGTAPPLDEDPEYSRFMDAVETGKVETLAEYDALYNTGGAGGTSEEERAADEDPPEHAAQYIDMTAYPHSDPGDPIFKLKRGLDNNGREIFVEEADNFGKAILWYTIDKDGNRFRHKRGGGTIMITRVE